MRIDVISIFPDYLAPLELSLPGKARAKGLVDVHVHDLRRWTHDRHHTTDDSPYGGGAGMVMKPEPWGEALDEVVSKRSQDDLLLNQPRRATIIFTTPSGEPFTQAVARDLATREHLVFACGRYEGIDQRVIEHAATIGEVREVSLGDYVLNGGEVAALAITEAVIRLLPGFMGNPDSLVEESHEDGLLEYPVYTKPATWRGRGVPEVLLSGNHAHIERWRREQALRRTAARRPDLAHVSAAVGLGGEGLDGLEVRPATLADVPELFTLQRACWVQEAQSNDALDIPPLVESIEDLRDSLGEWTTHMVRAGGRLIASGRGRARGEHPNVRWEIGRLMVVPDLQGRGLGRWLLEYVESLAPEDTASYSLFTGTGSARNLKMYKKAGYRVRGSAEGHSGVVVLTKRAR